MMERLYLYERIRRATMRTRMQLPLRRKGVYLSLLGGIMQGETYLAWCDAALDLLARGAADGGSEYGIMHGEASWPAT
jgi:hypothetical protein